MGRNLPRKLIMGVSALAATAVCLTSTTYAWFARNANAWTEEYSIRIQTEEGLEISIDGVNFTDTITKSQLTKAIALERYNLLNPDNQKTIKELSADEVATYGNTSLSAVSPDSNWDFWGFDTIDYQKESPRDYITNGLYTPVNLTQEKATASYLKFTLYFRAIPSSKDPKDKYKLAFADDSHREGMRTSYIEADDYTIDKLDTTVTVPEEKDLRENPEKRGTYKAGESITINPANAMRIGVTGTKPDRIYEINEGFGSSAYEGAPAGLNNPETNLMVTHFNNLHPSNHLYLRDYSEYVETIKNFDDLYSLGDFERNAEGKYNIVTATFYVWLDGYDADFIDEVNTDSIRFFLNFTKVEG